MNEKIIVTTHIVKTSEIADYLHKAYKYLLDCQIDKTEVQDFFMLWAKYLLDLGTTISNKEPLDERMYCRFIRHTPFDYKVEVCFDISELHKMILTNNKLLDVEKITLSECKSLICYEHYDGLKLLDNFSEQPIIGIQALCEDNGMTYPVEIIDGNHRISAAIENNIELDICIIKNGIFPPQCFRDLPSDWIKYNILSGVMILLNPLENHRLYLNVLSKALQIHGNYQDMAKV